MTITRAFGFTFDPQTGAVERWAAGDPASVAEHLDAARERMQSASVPTLAQVREKLGPLADAEVSGIVNADGPNGYADAREVSTGHDCKLPPLPAIDLARTEAAGG